MAMGAQNLTVRDVGSTAQVNGHHVVELKPRGIAASLASSIRLGHQGPLRRLAELMFDGSMGDRVAFGAVGEVHHRLPERLPVAGPGTVGGLKTAVPASELFAAGRASVGHSGSSSTHTAPSAELPSGELAKRLVLVAERLATMLANLRLHGAVLSPPRANDGTVGVPLRLGRLAADGTT